MASAMLLASRSQSDVAHVGNYVRAINRENYRRDFPWFSSDFARLGAADTNHAT